MKLFSFVKSLKMISASIELALLQIRQPHLPLIYSLISKSIDMSNWFTRRMANKKRLQEIATHIFRLGTGWLFDFD